MVILEVLEGILIILMVFQGYIYIGGYFMNHIRFENIWVIFKIQGYFSHFEGLMDNLAILQDLEAFQQF